MCYYAYGLIPTFQCTVGCLLFFNFWCFWLALHGPCSQGLALVLLGRRGAVRSRAFSAEQFLRETAPPLDGLSYKGQGGRVAELQGKVEQFLDGSWLMDLCWDSVSHFFASFPPLQYVRCHRLQF